MKITEAVRIYEKKCKKKVISYGEYKDSFIVSCEGDDPDYHSLINKSTGEITGISTGEMLIKTLPLEEFGIDGAESISEDEYDKLVNAISNMKKI